MQKNTLKELWARHLPDTGNLITGTRIDTKLTPEETLDDTQIKEILSRNVEIQYAAMTELAVKTAVRRSDPTCACSVGTNIFFCNDKEREELEKKKKQINYEGAAFFMIYTFSPAFEVRMQKMMEGFTVVEEKSDGISCFELIGNVENM